MRERAIRYRIRYTRPDSDKHRRTHIHAATLYATHARTHTHACTNETRICAPHTRATYHASTPTHMQTTTQHTFTGSVNVFTRY